MNIIAVQPPFPKTQKMNKLSDLKPYRTEGSIRFGSKYFFFSRNPLHPEEKEKTVQNQDAPKYSPEFLDVPERESQKSAISVPPAISQRDNPSPSWYNTSNSGSKSLQTVGTGTQTADPDALRANFLVRPNIVNQTNLLQNHLKATVTLAYSQQSSQSKSETESDSTSKSRKEGKRSSSSSESETTGSTTGSSYEERHEFKSLTVSLQEPRMVTFTNGSRRPYKLSDLSFSDYDNQGAHLIGVTIDGIDLSRSKMAHSTLGGVSANNSNMTDANWGQAHIGGGSFAKAHFTRATLDGLTALGVQFPEADFTGASLRQDAEFRNCNMQKAKFFLAQLTNASIIGSNLSEAVMNEAVLLNSDLSESSFNGANLAGTRFIGCNLSGVDFSKAQNIKTAIFENSFYLEGHEPKFTDGFTPYRLGLRRIPNPSLHHPLSQRDATIPNESLFSIKDLKRFQQENPQLLRLVQLLATPAKYSLNETLSVDTVDSFDMELTKLRHSFLAAPKTEDYYTPESRDPGTEQEKIPLNLGSFSLTDNNDQPYPDVRRLRDLSLAQQLHCKYVKTADRFWLGRMMNLYHNDYQETYRQKPEANPQQFLNWMKTNFNLYNDSEFNFGRMLEHAYASSESDSPVGFSAIKGYNDVKTLLAEKILAPLVFPMISPAAPSRPVRGWVFYGVPGVGKSFTAKQLANQMGLKPVVIDLSSIGSSYKHQPVRNLTTKFEQANRLAQQHGGAVILLDEMDQLGGDRNPDEKKIHNGNAEMVDTLLTLITRYIEEGKSNIVCVGTTNYLNTLDKALIRPGRLGEHLEIIEPDADTRRALLEEGLPDNKALTGHDPYQGSRRQVIDYLVQKTDGMPTSAIMSLTDILTGGYSPRIDTATIDRHLMVMQEQRKLK